MKEGNGEEEILQSEKASASLLDLLRRGGEGFQMRGSRLGHRPRLRRSRRIQDGVTIHGVCRNMTNTILSTFTSAVIPIRGSMLPTSGMKPPWSIPRRARHSRNEVLPLSEYWVAPTTDQTTICVGIQISGPTHLATS